MLLTTQKLVITITPIWHECTVNIASLLHLSLCLSLSRLWAIQKHELTRLFFFFFARLWTLYPSSLTQQLHSKEDSSKLPYIKNKQTDLVVSRHFRKLLMVCFFLKKDASPPPPHSLTDTAAALNHISLTNFQYYQILHYYQKWVVSKSWFSFFKQSVYLNVVNKAQPLTTAIYQIGHDNNKIC